MYTGKSGCIRAICFFSDKSGYIPVSGCTWEKVVVFGQKCLYSGKSGCIRARLLYSGKVVVIGQKWLFSDQVVVFGQKWLYFGKLVLFGQKLFYSDKWFYLDKSGCIRAIVVVLGQSGC